jgi:large subunit ribosomal protein L14
MVQKGTKLLVLDNCGAQVGRCIHVYGGYRKRYAKIGSIIKLSVIKLRNVRGKRKTSAKLKIKIDKGSVARALVVETVSGLKNSVGDSISFQRNACVLLIEANKRTTLAGTRVFSPVLNTFRKSGYSRLMYFADGIIRF